MDAPAVIASKMRSIELLMLCVVTFETWMHFLGAPSNVSVTFSAWMLLLGTPLLLVCYAVTLFVAPESSRSTAARRLTLLGFLLASLSVVPQTFPYTANHHYVFILIFGLFCLLDSRNESEAAVSLSALQRLVAIVFIWAGIKKLLHGNYIEGSFFAYQIAHVESFRLLFSLVLPHQELAELERLAAEHFSGPYRLNSVIGRAISHAAYAVEIIFGVGLLFARSRRISAVVLIGFLFITQLAAREVVFGVVMLTALLTFFSGDLNRKLLPAYVLLACFLAGTRLGILPEVTFF